MINVLKKFKLATCFALSVGAAAVALPAHAAVSDAVNQTAETTAAVQQQHPAQMKVANTVEQMLEELNAVGEDSPEAVGEIFETYVGPHVNYPFITASILGNKHLKELSGKKDKFNELTDLLKGEFKVSFTNALKFIIGNDVEVQPLRPNSDSKVAKVKLVIDQGNGPDIDVTFSLRYNRKMDRNDPAAWTIYDVTAEGISMLSSYRSQYASTLNAGGVQRLIDLLKEKQNKSAVQASVNIQPVQPLKLKA